MLRREFVVGIGVISLLEVSGTGTSVIMQIKQALTALSCSRGSFCQTTWEMMRKRPAPKTQRRNQRPKAKFASILISGADRKAYLFVNGTIASKHR
jgi:hypothetical protein